MKYLFLLFALLVTSLPAMAIEGGHAQPKTGHRHAIDWNATEQNVFIEIYAEKATLSPGAPYHIVIEQIIRPGWHTYWKNPGDSGEAMKAHWTLPDGFTASEILWPTPFKLPFDILLNYGYEGEVMTLQSILPPAPLPAGTISLPVRFDILVCKEICIPESVQTTLSFNDDGLVNLPADKIAAMHVVNARALMPTPNDINQWDSTWSAQGDSRILRVQTNINESNLKESAISFFPNEYGLLQNPAPPDVQIEGETIFLSQAAGDFSFESLKNIGGVLVIEDAQSGARFGYELMPTLSLAQTQVEEKTDTDTPEISIIHALAFAILGGLILNLMPCVFPVLSMKVLSLSKISEKSKSAARAHGLAYTAGIILSFLGIAGLLLLLKAGGSGIGWGFHLQNPIVIILLGSLFYVIGLNLAGYFEFGTSLMNIGNGTKKDGIYGSFITGILATIVATPCTAPFMAAALGYALVQPAYISLLIFAFLGLGLALPYLLIAFIPPLQTIMPRPGQWMVTFKEFLAFPMFATAIWLFWILSQQIGINGFIVPLASLFLITFGIWLWQHGQNAGHAKKVLLSLLAMGVIGIGLFSSIYTVQSIEMAKEKPLPSFGQAYSEEDLDSALQSDRPVFVEMTAAWCITCKVNHATSINIDQTKDIMARRDVAYLIGDWTNYDEHITKYLNKFGRNGVPIYIYYGRPDSETGQRPTPEILPQILSPSIMSATLDR